MLSKHLIPTLACVFGAVNSIPLLNYTDPGGIRNCIHPGMISLTFDDGPFTQTLDLLQILKQNNVKATFFVLGKQLENNATLQQIFKKTIEDGHDIGSHTYSHFHLPTLSELQIEEELDKTAEIIKDLINKEPKLMRIPYYDSNSNVLNTIKENGYEAIFHSIETNDSMLLGSEEDSNNVEKANQILQNVEVALKNSNKAKDSFIITQHDRLIGSINKVKEIILLCNKYGYRIVPIHECLGLESIYMDKSVPNIPAKNETKQNLETEYKQNAINNSTQSKETKASQTSEYSKQKLQEKAKDSTVAKMNVLILTIIMGIYIVLY